MNDTPGSAALTGRETVLSAAKAAIPQNKYRNAGNKLMIFAVFDFIIPATLP
jgi:hypothetical protein